MPQLADARRRPVGVASLRLFTVAAVAVATVPLLTPAAYAGPDDMEAMQTTVTTTAANVAARTDRRPVAGGVYDARARKTFITWGGKFEDNYIQEYDHRRAVWSAPVKVGDGGGDSHNYPTIVQADDGHLLVFRGMHNRELIMARSARPHSIEGGWTQQTIAEGDGATYPMPFKTSDGTIFVFVRETVKDLDPTAPTDLRPMKYVRSVDNGRTWRNSQQLTGDKWVIAPTDRSDNMNEIYIGQLRYEPASFGRSERVHIVYTLAGGGPEGHLHDRYHRNIYYTYFTPKDLRFHTPIGRSLGTRIDDAEQEKFLKVAETPLQPPPASRSPDYIQLVGTAGNRPLVVWMQLDSAGLMHTYVGSWIFHRWRITEVGTGFRVRAMEAIDSSTLRVYTTVDLQPNVTTYRLRVNFLGDASWRLEEVVPTPRPVQRIDIVDGARHPAYTIATGASSAREVSVADGDIYVLGQVCR